MRSCFSRECHINSECSTSLACIQYKCRDPCAFDACGTNAECYVFNHKAVCKCLRNYIGDPFESCRLKPEPKDPCQPNPCGKNTEFRRAGSRCVCECARGYFGDAYQGCEECQVHDDCDSSLACIGHRCTDPCGPEVCAKNAVCRVVDHNAICSCLPGYIGDPFVKCGRK